MTTINNVPNNDASSISGMLVGILLVMVILGALYFVYGFPPVRNGAESQKDSVLPDEVNINVTSPEGNQQGN